MKIVAEFDGYGLTAGKEYNIIFEYDTVYEVITDDGKRMCRPKGFFKEVANDNSTDSADTI